MKVLIFFAHPDDETMFAGGTLALLASQGAEIHYLCSTSGEGGEWGNIPHNENSNLGDIRGQELVMAVQAIGGAKSLTFLDYVDPFIGEDNQLFPFTDDIETLAEQVQQKIHEIQPDILLTHGSDGEYGHPAHIVCHQAAVAAVKAANNSPMFYGFGAFIEDHPEPDLLNKSDTAHIIVDVTSTKKHKLQAALSHTSQNPLFVRRWEEKENRKFSVKETLFIKEGYHRFIPKWVSDENDKLNQFLASTGSLQNK